MTAGHGATNASEYALLEINLSRKAGDEPGSYAVEMRFCLPGSDNDVRKTSTSSFEFKQFVDMERDHPSYGRALGRGLFSSEETIEMFNGALAASQGRGEPLRIRLAISPEAPELHALRWELLRMPDGTLVSTHERVFFSRYLPSVDWQPVNPLSRDSLRALVVVAASPDLAKYGFAPIDAGDECARAFEALAGVQVIVNLTANGHATLASMIDRLREGFDILYLVAHGKMNVIWLENDQGGVARVPVPELINQIAALKERPCLCVLVSCQSAGNGEENTVLSALGPRLVQAGVRAVVAMQADLCMPTARLLIPRFFRELMRDGQADRALAIARSVARETRDWWVPVLFTRLQSGRLFAFAQDVNAKAHHAPPNRVVREPVGLCPPTSLTQESFALGLSGPALSQTLPLATILDRTSESTRIVLGWEATLPSKQSIERPELEQVQSLLSEPNNRVIAILGVGGSGKSALMATLGNWLSHQGVYTIGLRLDRLDSEIVKPRHLQEHLDLPVPLHEAVGILAAAGPVVVLLDQLDALCDLMANSTRRLDLILGLISRLVELRNVQIVLACRPYEFEHDVRLRQLDPESLTLALPPWESIVPHIIGAGLDPVAISEGMREELRCPQVLRTFLKLVAQDKDPARLSTYHELQRELWNTYVRSGQGVYKRKKEALYQLAEWIARREQYVRPSVQMDDYRQELQLLASAGWVTFSGPHQSQVEFAHQSLFEFVMGSSVVESEKNLRDVLLVKRLRGRRRLWHVLEYLRNDNRQHYQVQLSDLWPDLRHHLKCMVIEFLGQAEKPEAYEINYMRQALQSPTLMLYAWRAVGRKNGWFPHIRQEIAACMPDPSHGGRVFGALFHGLQDHTDEIVGLLDRHWTCGLQESIWAARLLESLTKCTPPARALLIKISRIIGLKAESYPIEHLACMVHSLDPQAAFAMVVACVDAEVNRWSSLSLLHFRQRVDTRGTHDFLIIAPEREEEFQRRRSEEARRSGLCAIFAGNVDWSEFVPLVSADPRGFVAPMLGILGRASQVLDRRDVDGGDYKRDLDWPGGYSRYQGALIEVLSTGVQSLATRYLDEFERLLHQYQNCDSSAIHHLLLRGLERAALQDPVLLVEYLRGDARRLDPRPSGTLGVLQRIASGLPRDVQGSLAAIFLSTTSFESLIQDRPEERQQAYIQQVRFDRLRLLLTLNQACLDDDVREHIEAETKFLFPDEQIQKGGSWESERPARVPVSVETLRLLSDREVIEVLTETSIIAIASFFRESPSRALAIAADLQPEQHELYAGTLLEALADSQAEYEKVLEVFRAYEIRGFRTRSYRDLAANSLAKLADRRMSGGSADEVRAGLPDEVCSTLETWLSRCALASDEDALPPPKPRPGESILYGNHGDNNVPSSGSFPILNGIFSGLLMRDEPAWDRWLSVLEQHVGRGDRVQVWRTLVRSYVHYAQYADPVRAARLIGRIWFTYPELLETSEALELIDRVQERLDPEVTRSWIERIGSSSGDWHAQAFGELLVLRAWRLAEPWPRKVITPLVSQLDQRSVAVCRGVALMIAEILRHGCSVDDQMLAWLCELTDSDDEIMSKALDTAMWGLRESPPCNAGRVVLRTLAQKPFHLQQVQVSNVIELLCRYLDQEPAMVSELCELVLESSSGRVVSAPELLSLIATIETRDDLAEIGLRLFERACDLEVLGTQEPFALPYERNYDAPRSRLRRRYRNMVRSRSR